MNAAIRLFAEPLHFTAMTSGWIACRHGTVTIVATSRLTHAGCAQAWSALVVPLDLAITSPFVIGAYLRVLEAVP